MISGFRSLITPSGIKQIVRYLIAGSLGFATNFSTYLVLLKLGIPYLPASVIAFLTGMIVSFVAQKFFAFGNRAPGAAPRQALMHALLMLFNLGANTLFIFLLVEQVHVGEVWAALFTNGIIAVWSFFVYKQAIFLAKAEHHG
jgi:putative flippase GtrA